MFAGPNGSGKSTVIASLLKSELKPDWLGVYVNADDIEKVLRETHSLSLAPFKVAISPSAWKSFLEVSTLLQTKNQHLSGIERITVDESGFHAVDVAINSYHASVIADFLRHKLLEHRISFTFETVMSHPGKIAFLKQAQAENYRTYLYYIATEDPGINIQRVAARVLSGGHDVPDRKVVERYHRSLSLLKDAILASNRSYIFDNSRQDFSWIAEVTNGTTLDFKSEYTPGWLIDALGDLLITEN